MHIVAASIAKPVEGAASVRTTLTVAGRRVPHRLVGRTRAMRIHDAVTAGLVGRLLDGGADDVVHAWPLASARTLGRRGGAASRDCVKCPTPTPSTRTRS